MQILVLKWLGIGVAAAALVIALILARHLISRGFALLTRLEGEVLLALSLTLLIVGLPIWCLGGISDKSWAWAWVMADIMALASWLLHKRLTGQGCRSILFLNVSVQFCVLVIALAGSSYPTRPLFVVPVIFVLALIQVRALLVLPLQARHQLDVRRDAEVDVGRHDSSDQGRVTESDTFSGHVRVAGFFNRWREAAERGLARIYRALRDGPGPTHNPSRNDSPWDMNRAQKRTRDRARGDGDRVRRRVWLGDDSDDSWDG